MHAFVEALDQGDDAALEALCTGKGLSARGESIGRFLRQAKRSPLRWIPLAELVEEGRRAAICGLLNEPRTGRGHGKLWFTAVKDTAWRIEGYTKSDRAATLFATGVLPAIFQPSDLPRSAQAQAWASETLKVVQGGALEDPILRDGLERLTHDTVGTLVVIDSHQIAAIGRHVVGIGRRHGEDDVRQTTWFALQAGPEGQLCLVGHSNSASAALLLTQPPG